MDPDATYERWRRAARTGNDQAAADAHSDLMKWLNRGGFEPRWTEKQRAGFMAYGNENPTRSNFTSDAEHLRNTAIVVGGATLIGLIGYLIWSSASNTAAVSSYQGTMLGPGGSNAPLGPAASSSTGDPTTLVNTGTNYVGQAVGSEGINVGAQNPGLPTVPFLPSRA